MRIALAFAFVLSLTADARAQNPAPPPVPGPPPVPTSVWASKPTALPGYPAGVRPWIKVADVRAAHRGEANWRERMFDDGRLSAEYVAAAPGATQSARFHPDTREWFAVVEGEVRVEIEGQEPFTATRGSLVEHPAPDGVHGAHHRHDAEPALRAERGRRQDLLRGRRRRAAGAAGAGWVRLDAHDHQPQPRTLRRVQHARTSTSTRRARRTRSTPADASCATTSPRCW